MSEYFDKLQETLDYIESNIKEDIKIESLAAMCFYSMNHYQRIFQSVVGLTPSDYIKKRKLAMAACDILESDKKLIDIANDYGFNSAEVFSRTFKKTFDITAKDYRKLKNSAIPKDYWKVTFRESSVQRRYLRVVEEFTEKVKQDTNIVAVIVIGSLSYDKVWEKSDIDMNIIVNDGCKSKSNFYLMEDGICINGAIYTRTEFIRTMGKCLQGSIIHSIISLGTLIYCKDDAIREKFESIQISNGIGDRDKYLMVMKWASYALGGIQKVEKWLKVKNDLWYAHIGLLGTLKEISAVEVLLNNGVPNREVIHQALKLNNKRIEELYVSIMEEKKNTVNISKQIGQIYDYLNSRRDEICKMMIEYFEKVDGIKSLSSIVTDFNNELNAHTLGEICEWMCEENMLIKDSSSIHLTKKSSITVDEPAYFKMDMDKELFF